MMRRLVLLLIYFLISFSIVLGQRLNMKFYDPLKDQSLTNDYATDIIQDSNGIIWIATKDGLNAYNGNKIVKYVNDPEDSTSLVDNNILSLFEDSSGRLWISTNIGLSIYNSTKDDFINVVTEKNYNGMESPYIVKVVEDHENNIYVASENGLFSLNEDDLSFSPFIKFDVGEITEVIFDKKNNLWISSIHGGGIHYYDRQRQNLVSFDDFKGSDGLRLKEIRDITFYKDLLWIASFGEGVLSYDIEQGILKSYPVNDEYEKRAFFTYVDDDDRLWTCDLTGLKLYDDNLDIFYGYYAEEKERNNLKKNAVAIYQDKQGNYWTIHNPGGVEIRTIRRGIETYNTNPEWYWHTTADNITSFDIDAKGNWWIGNQYNGIDMFEWEKGKITTFIHDKSEGSLGAGTIFEIFADKDNMIWVGSYLGGLQYFDTKDSVFHSYTNDPTDPSTIANNDVRSIAEDKQGNLWLVVHGKGIDKFDRQTQTFSHYTRADNQLSNDWTFKVIVDTPGNLWVATSWGLSKLKPGEQQFQKYFNDQANQNSIQDHNINDVFEDAQGRIWIATSKGICKYNPDTDDFTRYSPGFKNSNISAIQEDTKGNLWLSSPAGIYSFHPEKNILLGFDERDGVQTGEFNRGVSHRDNDGVIYFGGVKGLNYFTPEKLYFNKTPPKVILTELSLFNNRVSPGDETGILDFSISTSDRIVLDYSQNVIGIEYAAMNFINPEKNRFKYMLEGFDNDWVNAGSKKEATYTNLSPGNYVFRVIAANNDQVWNNEGASLSIIVYPPWWMSWWFRVLAVLILILIISFVFYIRTARLRNQKLILEKMVEDRTQKLNEKNQLLKQQTQDLNEINTLLEERTQKIEEQSAVLEEQTHDLKNKNGELERVNITKDKLFSIIAHDLKNPFHAILSMSDMFYTKNDKLTDDDKIKIAEYINNSAKTVYSLLENLLNWARAQSNQIVYKPTDLDIYTIINENVDLLSKNASNKGISINFRKGEELMVRADQDMLNTICRNLINNAIKFTENDGEIKISIVEKDAFAEISITDNGIGMEEEILNNLFSIDKKVSRQGTSGEKGSALGLVICKDFIEKNGGKIKVESEVNKGSTFRFTVPVSTVIATS